VARKKTEGLVSYWATCDEISFICSLPPDKFAGYAMALECRTDWKGLDKDRVMKCVARMLPPLYKRHKRREVNALCE